MYIQYTGSVSFRLSTFYFTLTLIISDRFLLFGTTSISIGTRPFMTQMWDYSLKTDTWAPVKPRHLREKSLPFLIIIMLVYFRVVAQMGEEDVELEDQVWQGPPITSA